MAELNPSDYRRSPSSNGKFDFDNDQFEDDSDAPVYQEEPADVATLSRQLRELDEAIIANSGNKFDGWWYALLDIDELDVAASRKDRDNLTLAGLEEHATSGNFYERVPFEKILAERKKEGTFWIFRDEFLVTRKGFSTLRAEWHNTPHNSELKRGHEVREEWESRKDLEKGDVHRFSVAVWEERVGKDEELRWDRRRVALERRRICAEGLGEDISAWVEGRASPPEIKKEKGEEIAEEGR